MSMTDELRPFLTANNTFKVDGIVAYMREIPDGKGEHDMAFQPVVVEAMRQGYGCPNCLRYYGGVFMETCPDCGFRRVDLTMTDPWWTDAA